MDNCRCKVFVDIMLREDQVIIKLHSTYMYYVEVRLVPNMSA